MNLDDVDIAVVVNVEILRQILTKLSTNGKKWWIACEPAYAIEKGCFTIGYGDPGCVDRLNTVYYKLPIVKGGVKPRPPGRSKSRPVDWC